MGKRSRQDTVAPAESLGAVVVVLLLSLIASAVLTTLALIVADRFDRPSLVVADGSPATIVVEIEGAVATPGVYSLPASARLDDLLNQAGGVTDSADIASLNLAARVGDGESIVVPIRSTADPEQGGAATPVATRKVNINSASAEELASLPGIGPVLSERIVAYREENGAFTSLDQLVEVDGISAKLLGQLRPLITLDD